MVLRTAIILQRLVPWRTANLTKRYRIFTSYLPIGKYAKGLDLRFLYLGLILILREWSISQVLRLYSKEVEMLSGSVGRRIPIQTTQLKIFLTYNKKPLKPSQQTSYGTSIYFSGINLKERMWSVQGIPAPSHYS